MKSAREKLDILSAFQGLGSYRAAAALCGTTPKTVRRVIERRTSPPPSRPPRSKNTDPFLALIEAKVRSTDGRISAKRLLPLCRAEGYTGSARHFRRAVAEAKAEHHRQRRVYRPWVPSPGEVSLRDDHYGRPARPPVRAIRPRTPAEIAFLALGPVAIAFLRGAAAAGATRLPAELGLIADLERAHGRAALLAALEPAVTFGRFGAADVRSILAAGAGVPVVRAAGEHLAIKLPAVPMRPLAAYAEGVR